MLAVCGFWAHSGYGDALSPEPYPLGAPWFGSASPRAEPNSFRPRARSAIRPEKVLAQRLVLMLVGRADALAVEARRHVEHVLERQFADTLTVLDHERHVVCAHLQRRT